MIKVNGNYVESLRERSEREHRERMEAKVQSIKNWAFAFFIIISVIGGITVINYRNYMEGSCVDTFNTGTSIEYRVKDGDTIDGIAASLKERYPEKLGEFDIRTLRKVIASRNSIDVADAIYFGEAIELPQW